jgi:biotin operon repressor
MVDKQVDIRLTQTLDFLAKGNTQSYISRELKISRQAVSKYVNRLIAKGLITETAESTPRYKFYDVNPIISLSEGGLTKGRYHLVFDPHNYTLKFKMVPNGEGTFPKNEIVHKRNWDAFYLKSNMVDFELTTKHLLATMGTRLKFQISDSVGAESAKAMIHSIIIQEVTKIVSQYGMLVDMNHPEISRNELGIEDPKINATGISYRAETHKKVYPDDNKIEFRDPDHMKNFVDNRIFDNKIDTVMATTEKVMKVTDDLSENIKMHLSVLTKMGNNQDKQSTTMQSLDMIMQNQIKVLESIRDAIKTQQNADFEPKTSQIKRLKEWLINLEV